VVDPTVLTAKAGFVKLLSAIAARLESGGSREARSLKQLADRKLAELERTHEFFLGTIETLKQEVKSSIPKTGRSGGGQGELAKLERAIDAARKSRYEESETRRAQFEEAKVYARQEAAERGILVTVPGAIYILIRAFMESYCNYFRSESMYSHELNRILRHGDNVLEQLRNEQPKGNISKSMRRKEFVHVLRTLVHRCDLSQQALRAGWVSVSSAYHLLNARFREQGLVDSERDTGAGKRKHRARNKRS
jgi:hypothetical protein